jgi:molybdenum cofactor cytidylyltransferase
VASVTGIVMAAGLSRRLGRPKQTLPFGDTTLLGWVVRNAEASSLDRVLVVVGAVADEVVTSLSRQRAEIVYNDRFEEGPFSSVLAGVDGAGPSDAVMLLLGDMPAVDAGVIDTVAAVWRDERPWGAVTVYRGELGHPILFSAAAIPTVRTLTGRRPVWELVVSRPDDVQRVHVDRPRPLDVDTWEDYQRILKEGPPSQAR